MQPMKQPMKETFGMSGKGKGAKGWRMLMGVAALTFCLPTSAAAYIGPGAGLGAIAVTVALALGLVLLLFGLVWYPLKRVLKRAKGGAADADLPQDAQ